MQGNTDLHVKDFGFILYIMKSLEGFYTKYTKLFNIYESA